MSWVLFALGAALSWAIYGPSLHTGQRELGNPLRALLCVGAAYFFIGVLFPILTLSAQGQLKGFTTKGVICATAGGALGAIGAIFIIHALKEYKGAGSAATFVMPLVFGGAPVINTLFTMILHPPEKAPNPLFYVGFLLVVAGAATVLYFKP